MDEIQDTGGFGPVHVPAANWPAPTNPSLSASYLECIKSFESFLLELSDKNCRAIHLGQVHLSQVLDEYGRLKIWGDQTKAGLNGRSRGSLEDTLREDNELQDVVKGILMRLSALLGQATSIAARKYDPTVGSDQDSISSVSVDSSSDEDEEGECQPRKISKIELYTQQILEQIQSLYDLSSLLRRPRIGDKYIRSVKSKPEDALSDLNNLSLSVAFSSSDENHLIEKVLQWRGLTKNARGVKFETESSASTGQMLTNEDIGDDAWFCHQLAKANTRRREQLQYWAEHPYDSKQAVISVSEVTTEIRTKPLEINQDSRSQVSTLKPASVNILLDKPKSLISKQSFSTAAASDVFDANTNIRPRTIYAPTVIGKSAMNSVPDPPKTINGKATFQCPYCGTTLKSDEMKNRQAWKRHVFRDLRPYMCTFQDCQSGGKLYASRRDWIHHELQLHRRHYVCKDCHEVYSSKQDMSTHLKKHYSDSISPIHLGVMLELCNRQIDEMEGGNEPCLLCGEELPLSDLSKHLAAHMESIALFVLPSTDEDEAGDSDDSLQAAKLGSRDAEDDAASQVSSLGFSDAGDHGQTSAEFAELLDTKDPEPESKVWLWDAIEKERVPQQAKIDSEDEIEGTDFSDTDSASSTRISRSDFRLSQVKTRHFTTPSQVSQYWRWVEDRLSFEHKVINSTSSGSWDRLENSVDCDLDLFDIAAITWNMEALKIHIVVHSEDLILSKPGHPPRGDIMVAFRRKRSMRRFLQYCRTSNVKLSENSAEELDYRWSNMESKEDPDDSEMLDLAGSFAEALNLDEAPPPQEDTIGAQTSSTPNNAEDVTVADIPPTVPPTSEILLGISSISSKFGALGSELDDIENKILSVMEYDSFIDEIGSDMEPAQTRMHNAFRLQEIRRQINNPNVTDAEVEEIAIDVLPNIVGLCSDYLGLGNSIVQKLFAKCSDKMRDQMLAEIAPHMARIAINKNGTWVVQKIISVCETHSQKAAIVESLRPYIVPLFLDQFGNYILHSCLPFGAPYTDFIFETMVSRMWDIGRDQFGGRGMRACLESKHATEPQKMMVAAAIALHGAWLATDSQGFLLLNWYLGSSKFPNRYDVLWPQLVPYLVHLCTHKVAHLVMLKLIIQWEEPFTTNAILGGLFSTLNDQVLELILSDGNYGVTFIHSVITSSAIDQDLRDLAISMTKDVLGRLYVVGRLDASNDNYKQLMDEVGL